MGKPSAPTPPAAPDPNKLIKQQAKLNRINQFTPLGSVEFSGDNKNISTLSLTPEVQALLDAQIDLTGGVLDQAGNIQQFLPQGPIDFSGFSPVPTSDQFADQAQQIEKATFDRGLALLDESFGRREEQLRSRLANQGFPVGTEAFIDEFNLVMVIRVVKLKLLWPLNPLAQEGKNSLACLIRPLQHVNNKLRKRSQGDQHLSMKWLRCLVYSRRKPPLILRVLFPPRRLT